MEGEKDFDEEPVEALVCRLIRRGDTYKGKFKKLENAVTLGKTITTTSGTKLVTVPKHLQTNQVPRLSKCHILDKLSLRQSKHHLKLQL